MWNFIERGDRLMSGINKSSEDYHFESYNGMLLDEDVLKDFLEVQEQDNLKKIITILIKRSFEDKKRIYKLLDIANKHSKILETLENLKNDHLSKEDLDKLFDIDAFRF